MIVFRAVGESEAEDDTKLNYDEVKTCLYDIQYGVVREGKFVCVSSV